MWLLHFKKLKPFGVPLSLNYREGVVLESKKASPLLYTSVSAFDC